MRVVVIALQPSPAEARFRVLTAALDPNGMAGNILDFLSDPVPHDLAPLIGENEARRLGVPLIRHKLCGTQ